MTTQQTQDAGAVATSVRAQLIADMFGDVMSLIHSVPALGIEVYGTEISAVAFHGKSNKPDWKYRFTCQAHRDQAIAEHQDEWQKHADRKKAQTGKDHGIKVGDIYSSSNFGRTNDSFYEVVAVKGSQVLSRRIDVVVTISDEAAKTGTCVPAEGCYIGNKVRRHTPLLLDDDGRRSLKITSFSFAFPHRFKIGDDGQKVYEPVPWSAYKG